MKTVVSFFFFVCFSGISFAQNAPIIRQQGTVTPPTLYTSLTTAISQAVDGDTLYLPGGNIAPSGVGINKRLHLIGTGHNSDSTSAYISPTIIGDVVLYSIAASGGSLHGITFTGEYQTSPSPNYFIDDDASISNYLITRCRFISSNSSILDVSIDNGLQFIENVGNMRVVSSDNAYIYNNIFEYPMGSISSIPFISGSDNSIIKYNLFGNNDYINNQHAISGGANNYISNNIIFDLTSPGITFSGTNNTFKDNVFQDSDVNFGTNNVDAGNYIGVNFTNFFQSYTGGSYFKFKQQDNLRLQNPSAYPNVGIYAGPLPWKSGSVPFTPWVKSVNIGASTNVGALLPVNIIVKAQQR